MDLGGRTKAAVAVALLLVVAGCAGGGGLGDQNGDGGDLNYDGQASTPQATAAPGDGESGAIDAGDLAVQDRARIKSANVQLEVDDFDEARRDLTSMAEGYGGFVSDSHERVNRVDNETYTTGYVVLRVPSDDYTAAIEDVRGTGTVLEIDEDEEDVTEQLVDIRARLDNLEAQRERLRELYDDAEETQDVLQIEERLTEVQTDIERLEARQQSLERQVALSTIRVELREPRPDTGVLDRERWYDVGVPTAFVESVNGVVVTARALAVAVAYALPYLIVFGGPIALAALGIRRRRRRHPGGQAEAVDRIDEENLPDDEDLPHEEDPSEETRNDE